jgi:hypothetical protein
MLFLGVLMSGPPDTFLSLGNTTGFAAIAEGVYHVLTFLLLLFAAMQLYFSRQEAKIDRTLSACENTMLTNAVWKTVPCLKRGPSEAFRAAHSRVGGNKALYLDHPQLEGFEVRQTVGRGKTAWHFYAERRQHGLDPRRTWLARRYRFRAKAPATCQV